MWLAWLLAIRTNWKGITALLLLAQLLLLCLATALHPSSSRSREEVIALRRLLATLLSQLRWGLHRVAEVLRTVDILVREHIDDLARLDAVEDRLQIRSTQSLLLQQLFRQLVEVATVLAQNFVSNLLGLIHQHANFVVDLRCNILRGQATALPTTAVAEGITIVLAVLHSTDLRGHAVFRHHCAGDIRGHFNIGRCARCGVTEDQLLSSTATHGKYQTSKQLGTVVHALVVLTCSHRMTTGFTARQDRDLVHTIYILHRPRGERVTALVVGGDLLFVFTNDGGAATWPADYTISRFFQRIRGDDVAVHTSC